MLMQPSINCRIRHCWYYCPVQWVATHSSRAAKRDVTDYNNFPSWINGWHVQYYASEAARIVQELCKSSRAIVRRLWCGQQTVRTPATAGWCQWACMQLVIGLEPLFNQPRGALHIGLKVREVDCLENLKMEIQLSL